MTDWVTDVIDALGPAGVAFLVALENLFPPIPSEVVLPLAGFVAGRGDANVVVMIAAATVGSVIGALILYAIAAAIGPERFRRFVVRYGKFFAVQPHEVERAESWFDNYANRAVLICRCVPLIRSLVSIPAGFRRMPLAPFIVYTAIGSLVWNVLLVGAGYILGDRWEQVEDYVGVMQLLVIVAIVAVVAWFLWARVVRPRVRQS
jgi:membrane protein DedA with SNARE-associated domain